ncbi:DUF2059 domain-containing protein [Novosphingobium sp. B 225]|uniref:DUF2059 domain-containing protein n=1 Tax=Novosphingobium sp. B 225 TaxID=1961849 RepID=UPI000B4B3166|nr:DUF2059 domain-containing protein [Novosphingobium sp. B 225]
MIKRPALFAALALGLSAPAWAQSDPAMAAPPAVAAEAPIDAARLAAAAPVIDKVFPIGTYARIMNGSMDAIMGSVMDGVGKLPMRDLAKIGGLSEDELKGMGEGTLQDMMEIIDPAYQQRMDLFMKTMMGEMTTVMSQFEPAVRDGLTQAYAKHFTPQQLADLNNFFATPTGQDYAANSMLLFMDPAVMAKMQELTPALMQQMPAIMGKVEAATAGLPKPRTYKDLTKAERAKLAKLLGTTEAALAKKQGK